MIGSETRAEMASAHRLYSWVSILTSIFSSIWISTLLHASAKASMLLATLLPLFALISSPCGFSLSAYGSASPSCSSSDCSFSYTSFASANPEIPWFKFICPYSPALLTIPVEFVSFFLPAVFFSLLDEDLIGISLKLDPSLSPLSISLPSDPTHLSLDSPNKASRLSPISPPAKSISLLFNFAFSIFSSSE